MIIGWWLRAHTAISGPHTAALDTRMENSFRMSALRLEHVWRGQPHFIDLDLTCLSDLFSAFQRWQKEEPTCESETCRSGNQITWLLWGRLAISITQPPEVARPLDMASIVDAPKLDASELPSDRRQCPVCYRQHCSLTIDESIIDTVATYLPCAHVFCFLCLYLWVSSENANRNTCPYCRAQLFEAPGVGTSEYLEARIASVDWICQKVRNPPRDYRKNIRKWTKVLVQMRLEEAYALRGATAGALDAQSSEARRQLLLLRVRDVYLHAIQGHLQIANFNPLLDRAGDSRREWEATYERKRFYKVSLERGLCSMMEEIEMELVNNTLGV